MKPTMKLRVMRTSYYASDACLEHRLVPQQYWASDDDFEAGEWRDLPLVDENEKQIEW